MGVWIETVVSVYRGGDFCVTPCVGVWIETKEHGKEKNYCKSHPAWVCGLKQYLGGNEGGRCGHTLRGCVD